MQLTKLLVLATTMAISAHGANLKGTTEQAVEIATADSLTSKLWTPTTFQNDGWCSGSKSGFSASAPK